MSYLVTSRLAADQQISSRVAACAALEGIESPAIWAFEHSWSFAAQEGWSAAYATALASYEDWDGEGVRPPLPGNDEGAITDLMIQAAVTELSLPSPAN